MRFTYYYLFMLMAGLCFGGTAWATADKKPYIVEEQGQSTLRVLFDKKYPTSKEQWEYARATQNKGWRRKAARRMLYLVRRWPNSKEAPWAQRARADILYSRGKLTDAFDEYQHLIDNYSSRMRDYDSVLESQFGIATHIMNRKRMRWLFGGYRSPEYAVEYFESVVRNGPQWAQAPEAQYLIGQAYQESENLELAVASYAVLGYRYPDSPYAEDAAWRQIECLNLLRKEYPNSRDILDRTLVSSTVFLSTYPLSKYKDELIRLRNRLYEIKARKSFDEAAFYAKVPKKPEAAILYYQKMIKEFPKSKLVPDAEKQIAELEALMRVLVRTVSTTKGGS